MPITLQPDLSVYNRYVQTPEQQAVQQSLIDERRSLAEERRQKIDQARQLAKQKQQYQQIIAKRTNPQTGTLDLDGIENDLYGISAEAGNAFTKERDAHRKSMSDLQKEQFAQHKTMGELASQYATAGMDSPERLAFVRSIMPQELAQVFPTPDMPDWKDRLQAIHNTGLTATQKIDEDKFNFEQFEKTPPPIL